MRATTMLALALATACGGSQWYDTEVDIVRTTPVRLDAGGSVVDVDVHLEYSQCPGHQLEVIRGDATFAACMQRYPEGSKVSAHIEHYVTERNMHDWNIHRLGECDRSPDPDDEASFDQVEECEATLVNGVEEGFVCHHLPHAELLRSCPWFARH